MSLIREANSDIPPVSPVVAGIAKAVYETVVSMSKLNDFTWFKNEELTFYVEDRELESNAIHISYSAQNGLQKMKKSWRGSETKRIIPWEEEKVMIEIAVNQDMINECERRWNGSTYDATPIVVMYATTTSNIEKKLDSKPQNEMTTTKHHLYSLQYTSGCGEHHFGISSVGFAAGLRDVACAPEAIPPI